jgi:hypothetical protein
MLWSNKFQTIWVRFLLRVSIVPSKPAYQTVTYIKWHMPDISLIQLILLMMSTWVLETCRVWKYTYTEKNCASSWLFTRIIPWIYISSNVTCLRPQQVTVQITLNMWYNSCKWLLSRGSYETDAFNFLTEDTVVTFFYSDSLYIYNVGAEGYS